jgi:hypothetical protein
MLQGRSELAGIVRGSGFEPLRKPPMEFPLRLIRKVAKRGLAYQIVCRPDYSSVLSGQAAAHQLSNCIRDALRRPGLKRRSLVERQRATRNGEQSE